MDTVCPESVLIAKRKRFMITKRLVEGHEAATQLKLLLQKPFGSNRNTEEEEGGGGGGGSSVDELVANMQRCFTESLSVLTSSSEQGCGSSDKVGPNLQSAGQIGSSAVEYSGNEPQAEECRKRSSPPTKKNGGRGCYKRRRNAHSWTKVSPSFDDDHSWRKYGQKHILNSKFPRSYFRCSRKNDQGCCATKQVQRTQDNPEMYLITYIGFHTCKASLGNYSHPDDSNNKVLLINQQDHSIIIKQENSKEETTTPSGDDVTEHKLLDHTTIWSDLKDLDHNNGDTGVYSTVHFGTHLHDFHFDDDILS